MDAKKLQQLLDEHLPTQIVTPAFKSSKALYTNGITLCIGEVSIARFNYTNLVKKNSNLRYVAKSAIESVKTLDAAYFETEEEAAIHCIKIAEKFLAKLFAKP